MAVRPGDDEQPGKDKAEVLTKVLLERLDSLEKTLLAAQQQHDLQLYHQLESFHWLTQRLSLKGRLPSLRGWPLSPDVLLALHEWITHNKPARVVEFGSGVSTLVIADALARNGRGHLVSFEHSSHFGNQTREWLEAEEYMHLVTLHVDELVPWSGDHPNDREDQINQWYAPHRLEDLADIDLVLVDGPPGKTCDFARYPALPAIAKRLSSGATIWMDDADREQEKWICKSWAEQFDCELAFMQMEKGLATLRRCR